MVEEAGTVTYQEMFTESVRLWRLHGPQAAAQYVQDMLDEPQSPEMRGRLLNLLAKWVKRTDAQDALTRAASIILESLEVVETPAARADALCNMVAVCFSSNRVAMGLRYADEMDALLRDHPVPEVTYWEAPYLHNLGRLLSLAHDYKAARTKLERSRHLFAEQGLEQEEIMVSVSLSRVLLYLGQHAEAESICREVRVNPLTTDRIMVEVNLILMEVHRANGDMDEAQRLLDRAVAQSAKVVKRDDYRLLLHIMEAEALMASNRGDEEGAGLIRAMVARWMAVVRFDGLYERGVVVT